MTGLMSFAVLASMAPTEASAGTPAACVPSYVPGVGFACPAGDGEYELIDPGTGESAGFLHRDRLSPEQVAAGQKAEDGGTYGYIYTVNDPNTGSSVSANACSGAAGVNTPAGGVNQPGTIVWAPQCPLVGVVPPASAEVPELEPPRNVHCVDGDPGTYHIKVIYARSYDDATEPGFNGFALRDDEIVDMFRQANHQVDVSAMHNDDRADLKVQCDMGRIQVHRHVVWQPIDAVDFNTIRTELMTRPEFNEPEVKYWVYWDDARGCPGCAGMGQRQADTTKAVGNANNGNTFPTYAVTFNAGWTTILHEGGHTLGAVQDTGGVNGWRSPPHASLGAHCYDSLDIMCYNDLAQNGSLYGTAENCPDALEWDCGLDDYFSTDPERDNYLYHHWNIGDPMVRYIARDASTMDELVCPEDAFVGQTIVCSFRGGNPEADGVDYRVEWGDGTPDSTSGPHDPKGLGTATHAYTSHGWYRIHVYAQDDGGWPNESGGMPWTIQVHEVPEGDCVAGAQNQDTRDCPVDITSG